MLVNFQNQIWADQLLKMYTKWARKQGYKGRVTEKCASMSGGIESAIIEFESKYAYGYLSGERGVHCVTRNSQSQFQCDEVLISVPFNHDIVKICLSFVFLNRFECALQMYNESSYMFSLRPSFGMLKLVFFISRNGVHLLINFSLTIHVVSIIPHVLGLLH